MSKTRAGNHTVGTKKGKGSASAAPADAKENKSSRGRGSKVDRRTLVKKALETVHEKLQGSEGGKAIDDLVKLLKLEKELGVENEQVQEVRARWVPSEAEESSKER